VDDVYKIELPRALEILKEEKKKRGFKKRTGASEVSTEASKPNVKKK
jgi:topoisomerase IA-like protein